MAKKADIKKDLRDQLERNGTVGKYYEDMVDDYGTTAIPEALDSMYPDDANNIEKLLQEIETNINHMLLSFWGCGEIGCGEV